MTPITPTVGRKVHYRPTQRDIARLGLAILDDREPLDATIAFVHPSNGKLNLAVCDHEGNRVAVRGVPLRQPDDKPPAASYCEWMPYQAAKAHQEEQAREKGGE